MPDYPGDWLPSRGWVGWRTPFDLRKEEELWERYLFEYEPAWPSEVDSKSLGAPILRRRATEIAITLSSEPLNVRRVSRWRRHHPTAEWERLRGWLKDPEIRNAVQRLDRMGLLGRPGLIIR